MFKFTKGRPAPQMPTQMPPQVRSKPPMSLGIGLPRRVLTGPQYTGSGAGPTEPVNTAKINQINSMLQGKPMKKGGSVKASSASKRADGCIVKGKTRGKIV